MTIKPFEISFFTGQEQGLCPISSLGRKGNTLNCVSNVVVPNDRTQCYKIFTRKIDLCWDAKNWDQTVKIVQVTFFVELEEGTQRNICYNSKTFPMFVVM